MIIDEAGMADALSLDTAVQFIIDRGGGVRLVGDDQRLAADPRLDWVAAPRRHHEPSLLLDSPPMAFMHFQCFAATGGAVLWITGHRDFQGAPVSQ